MLFCAKSDFPQEHEKTVIKHTENFIIKKVHYDIILFKSLSLKIMSQDIALEYRLYYRRLLLNVSRIYAMK